VWRWKIIIPGDSELVRTWLISELAIFSWSAVACQTVSI
jgi:hypothetical protein